MTRVLKGLQGVQIRISYDFPGNADRIQYKASNFGGRERKSKRLPVTIP